MKRSMPNALWNGILVALVAMGMMAGCAGFKRQSGSTPVPEIYPGVLPGYLPTEALPNSLSLLPPPPAEGRAAFALDKKVSRSSLGLRGTARWALAIQDANLMFPEAAETFSCAIGAPITEKDTPHLYMLLRRTLADAGLSTYTARKHYQRLRPFTVNQAVTCTPDEEDTLRSDGSYPSGHTAVGWVWALILCEIAPERCDAILTRGRAFGQSRMVCNVHWQSDVNEGRFMGAATAARLHGVPEFLAAVDAAKIELATVRARGLKPMRDCGAEASALAIHPSGTP